MKRKLTALLLAFAVCLGVTACGQTSSDNQSGDSEVSYKHKESRTITDCEIGTEDGYGYELWKDNGTTSMTLMEGGNFSCEWSDINNALFRRGMKFDCTKTWQEIGSINLEYDVDYNPDGNSYLALYGWTRQPLVEYYIVESWGNWRPPGGSPTATVEIDGDPYDIYETTRYNQPSIDGNTTFQQYWCVRQEPRTKGTLKVGTAFATWEALGMPMGKLYEASFTVEGYQSRGSATIHKNILVIEEGAELPAPAKGAEPEAADGMGYYVRSDFESGTDGWEQRGSSKLTQSAEAAHSGEKSLKVTGRQDAWNGAARTLKPNTYTPGSAFSFGVYAMQDSKDTETFKLTLQYNANGSTNYVGIAKAEGKNGEWVKLENPSFTIPKGASGMILYVETDSGKADFYIDDAAIAVDGVFEPLENCIPDGAESITESHFMGGNESANELDSEEAAVIKSWLAGFECEYVAFENGEEPGNVEGGEIYSVSTAEGSDLFSYCNYGGDSVYILARGNWYKVKNPSDPPRWR